MLEIVPSNQFKRDLKLAKKRGLRLELLQEVVDTLSMQKSLPDNNRDHALSGNYAGFRECHIQPDWLLVYRINAGELFLFLSRTGTHADLFA